MKLATWNVNSLKVRLPQVLEWAGKHFSNGDRRYCKPKAACGLQIEHRRETFSEDWMPF